MPKHCIPYDVLSYKLSFTDSFHFCLQWNYYILFSRSQGSRHKLFFSLELPRAIAKQDSNPSRYTSSYFLIFSALSSFPILLQVEIFFSWQSGRVGSTYINILYIYVYTYTCTSFFGVGEDDGMIKFKTALWKSCPRMFAEGRINYVNISRDEANKIILWILPCNKVYIFP